MTKLLLPVAEPTIQMCTRCAGTGWEHQTGSEAMFCFRCKGAQFVREVRVVNTAGSLARFLTPVFMPAPMPEPEEEPANSTGYDEWYDDDPEDHDRDIFAALTDGQYGDYEDWRGDSYSLREHLGLT